VCPQALLSWLCCMQHSTPSPPSVLSCWCSEECAVGSDTVVNGILVCAGGFKFNCWVEVWLQSSTSKQQRVVVRQSGL
jgi:hypothetical protein